MTYSVDLAALQAEMEAAAKALDFETARRLRDRIAVLRGGGDSDAAEAAENAGLSRQSPGAMGLGTSQQRGITPPEGWRPPTKPDPMTSGTSRRRR